jgi:hypothetical protein
MCVYNILVKVGSINTETDYKLFISMRIIFTFNHKHRDLMTNNDLYKFTNNHNATIKLTVKKT